MGKKYHGYYLLSNQLPNYDTVKCRSFVLLRYVGWIDTRYISQDKLSVAPLWVPHISRVIVGNGSCRYQLTISIKSFYILITFTLDEYFKVNKEWQSIVHYLICSPWTNLLLLFNFALKVLMKRHTNFVTYFLGFACLYYIVLFISVCIFVYTINYKLNVIIVKILLFSYICYYYTYCSFIELTHSRSNRVLTLHRFIECMINK